MSRDGTTRLLSDFGRHQHFNPEAFDAEIEEHGVAAELRGAMLCPCSRIETPGKGRAGCPTCNGLGFTYPEELRTGVMALISTRQAKQADMAAGRVYQGGANVTFPTGILPGRSDLILPDKEVHLVHEQLVRPIQEVDPSSYRSDPNAINRLQADQSLMAGVPDGWERLRYPDGVRIELVMYLGPGRQPLVAQRGVDYTYDGGDRLQWVDGRGPDPGRGYTVRYQAPAVYVLGDAAPKLRAEGQNELPYWASMQRLDRWGEPDLIDQLRSVE